MIHDPFLDPPRRYAGCLRSFAVSIAVICCVALLAWTALERGVEDSSFLAAVLVSLGVLWLYRRRPRPPGGVAAKRHPAVPPPSGVVFLHPSEFQRLLEISTPLACGPEPFGLRIFTSPSVPLGSMVTVSPDVEEMFGFPPSFEDTWGTLSPLPLRDDWQSPACASYSLALFRPRSFIDLDTSGA